MLLIPGQMIARGSDRRWPGPRIIQIRQPEFIAGGKVPLRSRMNQHPKPKPGRMTQQDRKCHRDAPMIVPHFAEVAFANAHIPRQICPVPIERVRDPIDHAPIDPRPFHRNRLCIRLSHFSPTVKSCRQTASLLRSPAAKSAFAGAEVRQQMQGARRMPGENRRG